MKACVILCCRNNQLFAEQGVVFKGSKGCVSLEVRLLEAVAFWKQECN